MKKYKRKCTSCNQIFITEGWKTSYRKICDFCKATNCLVCGKALKGQQRKYCSEKCRMKLSNKRNLRKIVDHQNKRRLEKRIELINILGGKCSICGYDKNYAALEFHHKEGGGKKFNLSADKLDRKREILLKELEKCILACVNCHRNIHSGKLGALLKEELNSLYFQEKGKCVCCGVKLPKARSKFCSKECKRKTDNKRVHLQSKIRRLQIREEALIKLGNKCSKCGLKPVNKTILEFHHNGEKDSEINILLGNYKNKAKLGKELEKCILLCGNCHREEHNPNKFKHTR